MTTKLTTHTRRELIVLLLENYNDVEAGLRDVRGDGDHLPLMCRPWNKPKEGYPELDHQIGVMRDQEPQLYWHLAETYFRSTQRRVLQCPRCRGVMPSWSSANFHKHGHQNIAVVPRVVRIVREGVRIPVVEDALTWLERNWRGEPFLPEELIPAA